MSNAASAHLLPGTARTRANDHVVAQQFRFNTERGNRP
jgi:hypothetical protein